MKCMSRSKEEVKHILDEIETLFPNASCELVYHNLYELIVAVSLSAQTTDKAVNLVTPRLFEKYPTVFALAKANAQEVRSYIQTIGLSHNKSKNLVAMAKMIVSDFQGQIPSNQEDLEKLPGVGRKTANVVLTEGYKIPRIPVDTHVERVSKRLGIVQNDASVVKVEETLMSLIEEERWHKAHHLLLFMGRYKCLARNPKCEDCFYKEKCIYNQSKK